MKQSGILLAALLLCTLWLLCASARAEGAASLPLCTTQEEVEAWIDFGLEEEDDGIPSAKPVAAGRVRHIAQDIAEDPTFIGWYWLGGEEGSRLDLTQRTYGVGQQYKYYCGNMCTRAVYSMALSYLGIDCTPGDMSALMGVRDLEEPYDKVTEALGVLERVTFSQFIFDQMYAQYEQDSTYSPVYLYFRKDTGAAHALLIVARTEKENGFWVVDPAGNSKDGGKVHVFRIRFNTVKKKIIASTFDKYVDGTVVCFCQWRLTAGE